MKKYELIPINPTDAGPGLKLVNLDANPMIDAIEFISMTENYLINLYFPNETPELRDMIHKNPKVDEYLYKRQPLGYEVMLIDKKKLNVVIQLMDIIQTIDPIPSQVFQELKTKTDLDLTIILKHHEINQLAATAQHQQALELALAEDAKGDNEALNILVTYYQQNSDLNNYLNVLANYPNTHPSFVEANQKRHDLLLDKEPANEDEKTVLLEQKLTCMLNTGNTTLSSHYFDELCGHSGVNPKVSEIKCDAKTLVQISRVQRQMQKEIDDLKAQLKAAKETVLDEPRPKHPRFF